MARSNRHFLWLVVVVLMSFASNVQADGLVYQLPADGAWVRYKLSELGHWTITFPADAKVPPGLKDAQKLPIKSAGSLELRSVGQHDLDGERCRWIELEVLVESLNKFPDPNTGELQNKRGGRHIVLKMLIPEKHLRAGADPLAHVRMLYFKDGDREPELVDDEKAKQYELDRFRPIFPAPAQRVDKSQQQQVGTLDEQVGTLECEKRTFESEYEGPLARGRSGWWSWHGKHEVCLHQKIPFGVASLKYTGESDELSGDKLRSTVILTKELMIEDMGTAAKSKLPDSN